MTPQPRTQGPGHPVNISQQGPGHSVNISQQGPSHSVTISQHHIYKYHVGAQVNTAAIDLVLYNVSSEVEVALLFVLPP